jgi:hypothetical protein
VKAILTGIIAAAVIAAAAAFVLDAGCSAAPTSAS